MMMMMMDIIDLYKYNQFLWVTALNDGLRIKFIKDKQLSPNIERLRSNGVIFYNQLSIIRMNFEVALMEAQALGTKFIRNINSCL